ncbi:hypothetical protein [Actinomadura terrae]|uniref:hypothetical protein n=1 Tax=Actinomadura terrae TaxID=604353 RepID=UPI001FA7D931|nr:hypothetical protein [Actinomadura terrae]
MTVTIAAVLWILEGGVVAFAAVTGPLISPIYNISLMLFLLGYGTAMIIAASRMMRGSERARTTVTIMGCLMLIGIWTVVLIVPALILQYLSNSRAWFHTVNARPTTSPSHRKNRREIGILFDIDALGDEAYKQKAYKILFANLEPQRLRNCSIRDGDTYATLHGTARLYCIAIRSPEPLAISYVQFVLRGRNDVGLPEGNGRFLAGAVARREPLDHAADVDNAGNLIPVPGGVIQPSLAEGTAWNVISA